MENGVMMQYFEWNLPNDGKLWKQLKEEAALYGFHRHTKQTNNRMKVMLPMTYTTWGNLNRKGPYEQNTAQKTN